MGACGGGAFVDRWWVTGERDAGYTDRWGAYERIGVGRLVVAVAASAAICVSGTARAESPRATIEGQLDRDLREAIDRAVGETDKPIANRFEARRRANDAGEDAIAVLRSEGYYAYEVEPDVGDDDPPRGAVQQRYPEIVFEQPDALADIGRRLSQSLGSRGKAGTACYFQKDSQVIQRRYFVHDL